LVTGQNTKGFNCSFGTDLAGIMGLHSLINQDQYHASLSDKTAKADPNIGWDGVTKVRGRLKYKERENVIFLAAS
jgi:hypothetical protein